MDRSFLIIASNYDILCVLKFFLLSTGILERISIIRTEIFSLRSSFPRFPIPGLTFLSLLTGFQKFECGYKVHSARSSIDDSSRDKGNATRFFPTRIAFNPPPLCPGQVSKQKCKYSRNALYTLNRARLPYLRHS